MRWTQTLIPTLKETPAEAEILSHQLLLRAGLVRRVSGGIYTFLPLGVRTLKKVERIVREEMDRAGAIEVLMPALQPSELWQESGRYETMADALYRLRDRAKKEWVLGPTHEEVITTLAGTEISSYRQLPKNFYQIQVKFRDEIRPRFGLMRAREFIMKDAYSFDVDDAAAERSYLKMYDAYRRIFDRCGIRSFPVEADTGVIGGSLSHEFMVPAETGENEVVYCESGDYAANLEKASSQGPKEKTPTESTGSAVEKFPTPGVKTIEALAKEPYSVPASAQIKTLVMIVSDQPVLVLLRGDDQLNEAKFSSVTGTTVFRPATSDEIFDLMGAHAGSLGAVKSSLKKEDLTIYADELLRDGAGLTTGANEDGFHFHHVDVARDLDITKWADLRTVRAGELCVTTGKPLKIQRAIEVGHVFKLGTKYSEKLNARYLDEQSHLQPMVMGCYGIGITRTLQAVIEQSNDKDGIIWPKSVAPYTVCITPLDVDPQGTIMPLAERFYRTLEERGVDVLLDDRDERPGVKFKDSELIGIPVRIALGERSLSRGEVEIKQRGGELESVKTEQAIDRVMELLAAR